MDRPLIIISLDAMGSRDFQKLSQRRGFQTLLARGSHCPKVQSVYPSLTYPAHVTIVTGKQPKNHGVINNTKLQPGRIRPDWFWYQKQISGETLWDLAHKQKKKVASLLWPVTGGSKIKYNLPEIFPVRRYQSQVTQVLAAGSPRFALDLDRRFGHLRRGIQQPDLDNFTHASALDTFFRYRPDLTLIHYVEMDALRHEFGFDSPQAQSALDHYGQRIDDWVDKLTEAKLLDQVNLVVLGDHSHLPVSKVIRPNVYLKEKGYLKCLKGEVLDWQAIFKSCDGSGYIYLNSKEPRLKKKIRQDLLVFSLKKDSGIRRILDGPQAGALGADPTCAFMLEADAGYYFDESLAGPLYESTEKPDLLKSSHGFDPGLADYTTAFLLAGPGIKENQVIPNMHLTEIGPTLAKLMGSSLWGVDGRIRYEFFRDILPDQ